MADMITHVYARNDKELRRKLDEVKANHIVLNPNKEIIVEVLDPKPIVFDEYTSTQFTISVTIKEYDEE